MNDQVKTLNAYFWNVGNDIADIRLLAEGALALYEGDAEPLHRLGMKNNAEAAASAFDTIGTALYDLREKIAEMGVHALRHTFATRAIESGMDVRTLSEILGHTKVALTLQLYAHSSMETKQKELAKMDAFL